MPSKERRRNLPNVLRCLNKACLHTFDVTPELELPMRCPECGGRMSVRCGTAPRPHAGRDHRCYKPAKRGQPCNRHGGSAKVKRGPEHPAWTDGHRSRYARVPQRYRRAVEEAMDDPLAQREMRLQLALFDALQVESLERLGTGESGEAWLAIGDHARGIKLQLSAIRRAREEGEVRTADRLTRELLAKMEDEVLPMMDRGVGEEAARRELIDIMVKRSRILRVQQQGEQTVPVAVLATMQARFAYLVTKYLTDPRTLLMMVAELRESEFPGWTAAEPAIRRLTQPPMVDVTPGHGGSSRAATNGAS